MFRLPSGKSFILIVFFLLGANACGWRSESEKPASAPTPFAAPEIQSDIPFPTKEPDVFQTEIVFTTAAGDGEKGESRAFVARSNARHLTVFDVGDENEIARLSADGKIFRMHRRKKIYTEEPGGAGGGAFEDFVLTEWLNKKTPVSFERLETENNLTKYRVMDADSPKVEVFIYIDENLKFPVRQEFYSINNGEKTLGFSAELKNFKTEADDGLFQVPPDYKKVSAKEFDQALWREKFKK